MNIGEKWSRSTEPRTSGVFHVCRRGYSDRDAASDSGFGVDAVERFYHQMVLQRISHQKEPLCPRMRGIDEQRFSRKIGFGRTFCNLERHSVFDVTPGRSESELRSFIERLQGCMKVEVVCMDKRAPCRKLVGKWFGNAE